MSYLLRKWRYGSHLAMLSVLSLAVVWFIGCGQVDPPGTSINPPPEKGQTSFETDETSSDGRQSFGPGVDGGKDMAGAPSNEASKDAAPSGRTGTVEEADLYRTRGNLLFYLNTYKGLTLFDLSDPSDPKKLYNLPVYGYPIEMFVEKNTVYALVRDALYLLSIDGKFQFKRRYVSQLVTIDISDLKQPKIMQRFDITGQLREGVSRKIDNTIYVVSYMPKYYWWGWGYERPDQQSEQVTVYSFDVANPQAVKMVQSLELLKVSTGSSSSSGSSGASPSGDVVSSTEQSSSFSGITISATSNTLLVGEQWYHWNYTPSGGGYHQCGSYESYQETVLHIVDISDPSGKIRVHSKFKIRGALTDQFKQTYIYEEDKKRGVYLGIYRRQEWSGANCQGESLVRNTLVSIDVSDGKNPQVLGELAFGKPNETVRGSLFDVERGVAFAITAQEMDPLYAISFKDPAKLKILSEIDGLSGDINLFRFIEGGKYLLALGRDNSASCTGFGDEFVATNMAASIIDVRDLNKIRLVQRKCVAIKGAQWVNSEINWNLDQAHKMIGMYSDKDVNLLTIPVSYYTQNEDNMFHWWWYEYKSAIGIMKWDLSKYDPTKDHTKQDVIENIATMIHPKGSVKRTIILKLSQNGSERRIVTNLSDTHISLIDLDDLSNPKMLSTFEIAPYIRSIYRFGDYVVEQVNLGENYDQYNEFRVKKLGTDDINDAAILSRFVIGQIRQVMRAGNYLLFFRYKFQTHTSEGKKYIDYDYQKSEMLIIDLSDPTKPKIRGTLEVPFPFIPYYRFFCGIHPVMDIEFSGGRRFYPGYNQNHTRWIMTADSIISLINEYDSNANQYTYKLLFIDFSNPDKPSYKTEALTTKADYLNLVSLDDKTFYLTLRKEQKQYKHAEQSFTAYRYFTQPWYKQGNVWKANNEINIPGNLLRVFRDGQKINFLTNDYGYIRHPHPTDHYDRYQYVFRLYLLEQDGSIARLRDYKTFLSWSLRNMLLDGNRLYMLAARDWFYTEMNPKAADNQSDHLMIYDLSNSTFKQLLSSNTLTYNLQLMGIHSQRLFLNLQGDGVLVVDVSNPAQPAGLHFERTLGWLTHIEFAGDIALLAAGHFGIYQLNLLQTTIPSL